MPLSPSTSRRALKHARAIQIEAFARGDGLWDVDAHLIDTKTDGTRFASGRRKAKSPLHNLSPRLNVDTSFNAIDAEVALGATAAAYGNLVGLKLSQSFRTEVRECLAGVAACTHFTKLTQVQPIAVAQAFADQVSDMRDGADNEDQRQKPFQLDRCHALRSDDAAVAKYYPCWAVAVPAEAVSS